MDQRVGEILDELEEAGLLDETIVFFFSDHGDGLPRMKRWIYDSGLRVPFIIRWPDGRGAGTVNDELVSFVDLAPTMLSITGLPIPDHLQGQSFLGEQKAPPRKYVFAARDRMDPAIDNMRAVRDRRFKYIRNYMPERPYVQFLPYRDRMGIMQVLLEMDATGALEGPERLWFRKTKPLEELYDTEVDPHEIDNLAEDPDYAEKLAELRAAHERVEGRNERLGVDSGDRVEETALAPRWRTAGYGTGRVQDGAVAERACRGDPWLRHRRSVDRVCNRRYDPLEAIRRADPARRGAEVVCPGDSHRLRPQCECRMPNVECRMSNAEC